jgi:hypothetical protein
MPIQSTSSSKKIAPFHSAVSPNIGVLTLKCNAFFYLDTQALDGKLDFIVPTQLEKFKGQQVHVTAVFRRNFHLFNVESAAVRITT